MKVTGEQIKDNTIQRKDIDVTTVGQSVITKIIQGSGVTIQSTGADAGTGDVTINFSGNAGGGQINEIEVNFGNTPVMEKMFNIIDAAVTATTKIIAVQSGSAPTGKNADDNEMDVIHFTAFPKTGNFDLYATVISGFKVGGFYKVLYTTG
jgi:hypothetical protein